ncbi:hypothetical protein [Methanobrevibacter curvatus]|nr:hypothetical protein [Methanobrevibacter curvatus]
MEENNFEMKNILLYMSSECSITLKVIIDNMNEIMLTTQKTIVNLFNVATKKASKHLNNIFEDGGLDKSEITFNVNNSTIGGSLIINPESTKQPILYDFDAIISVG